MFISGHFPIRKIEIPFPFFRKTTELLMIENRFRNKYIRNYSHYLNARMQRHLSTRSICRFDMLCPCRPFSSLPVQTHLLNLIRSFSC